MDDVLLWWISGSLSRRFQVGRDHVDLRSAAIAIAILTGIAPLFLLPWIFHVFFGIKYNNKRVSDRSKCRFDPLGSDTISIISILTQRVFPVPDSENSVPDEKTDDRAPDRDDPRSGKPSLGLLTLLRWRWKQWRRRSQGKSWWQSLRGVLQEIQPLGILIAAAALVFTLAQVSRQRLTGEAELFAMAVERLDVARKAGISARAGQIPLLERLVHLRTNLEDINASNVNLAEANLRKAILADADLKKATLTTANLTRADLSGAKLVSANLTNAILNRTVLVETDLTQANLKNTEGLTQEQLDSACGYFDPLNIPDGLTWTSHACQRAPDFAGVDLPEADLSKVDLTRADLTDANLTDAVLTGVLREADLRRAVLQRADLTEAILSEADLTEAFLREAVLSDAYLFRSDLASADLQRADLTEAFLREAVLSEAYLDGARLTKAARAARKVSQNADRVLTHPGSSEGM